MPPVEQRQTIEIGLPESAVQDVPKAFRNTAATPILKLMKDSTGMRGNILYFTDAMTLASDMNDGKIQIGIFQGHELAWARTRYADLVPIAVAVPMNPVQTFLLVRADSKAKSIGDLANDKISLPSYRPDFCEMFLAKQKQEQLKDIDFAGQIDAATATDAIFDVIDGKAGCTVVDASTLKFFEAVQPGAYKNVRILCQSEVFPDACITVKKNDLDEKTIEQFRQTLLNVRNLPGGPPLLTALKLKSFAKVPDDYEQSLKNIEKQYPMPAAEVKASARK